MSFKNHVSVCTWIFRFNCFTCPSSSRALIGLISAEDREDDWIKTKDVKTIEMVQWRKQKHELLTYGEKSQKHHRRHEIIEA